MIRDLVFSSRAVDGELRLAMSDEVFSAMTTLRAFLYENVYRSSQVHREFIKAKKILSELYAYLLDNAPCVGKRAHPHGHLRLPDQRFTPEPGGL
jgi:dGTPase